MEIVCKKCQSKFKIADNKIPAGRSIAVTCPKCGEKNIQVFTGGNPGANPSPDKGPSASKKETAISFDASEKPFDYLQEGVESALLCEHDLEVRQKIHSLLDTMNYHVVEAASSRNALKYMRYHTYDLIVVNEKFEASGYESNHVLQYLSTLPISIRRDMFLVLFSDTFRTMDNMAAFHMSVNLVVNLEDVDEMEKILKGALRDHRSFYKVFRESLVKTGRV